VRGPGAEPLGARGFCERALLEGERCVRRRRDRIRAWKGLGIPSVRSCARAWNRLRARCHQGTHGYMAWETRAVGCLRNVDILTSSERARCYVHGASPSAMGREGGWLARVRVRCSRKGGVWRPPPLTRSARQCGPFKGLLWDASCARSVGKGLLHGSCVAVRYSTCASVRSKAGSCPLRRQVCHEGARRMGTFRVSGCATTPFALTSYSRTRLPLYLLIYVHAKLRRINTL
jgi:hypothetical protein